VAHFEVKKHRALGWRRMLGVLGAITALPFFAWLPLGLLEFVPSMMDVFGIPGLRIPASLTIGGLLVAAVAFYEPQHLRAHSPMASTPDRKP